MKKFTLILVVILLGLFWMVGIIHAASSDEPWLAVVQEFADNVILHASDKFGEEHTPLFADGLDIITYEPVRWQFNGKSWIISNMASQQNFFRTLTGLTNLTGDPSYKEKAKSAISYMFKNYRTSTGLLYWGGHQFIDLETDTRAYGFDSNSHEFKNHFPFYELMWEVDSAATIQFIEAFWNAHVINWRILDMNRHGDLNKRMGLLWGNSFGDPEPFYQGDGLTFINAGTDLIYAAAVLYKLSGDVGALTWSKRLAEQYVNARHPMTKLGVYQFSQPRQKNIPPSDFTDSKYTTSGYGDRAKNQFGPEFGDIALEGNLLWSGIESIYGHNALIQLQLAELLGDDGQEFLEWTREGLAAYAKYGYVFESNMLRPMWTDGTDLSNYVIPRYGYYGNADTIITQKRASTLLLSSYALGYQLTKDIRLWEVARGIALGHGLGDLGPLPGENTAVNLRTTNADPVALFGVLDIYRAYPETAYLELAKVIGNNIVRTKYRNGFFLASAYHVNAKIDAVEPLALLALEAAVRGTPELVPRWNSGDGYIHGTYDGHGRTYDYRVMWNH